MHACRIPVHALERKRPAANDKCTNLFGCVIRCEIMNVLEIITAMAHRCVASMVNGTRPNDINSAPFHPAQVDSSGFYFDKQNCMCADW